MKNFLVHFLHSVFRFSLWKYFPSPTKIGAAFFLAVCWCLCFSYKHNAVVLSGFLLLSVLFSYGNKREIGPLLEYLSRKHVVIQPQKVNSINKLSRLFLNAFTTTTRTTTTTIIRVKPLICVCLSRFYENTWGNSSPDTFVVSGKNESKNKHFSIFLFLF